MNSPAVLKPSVISLTCHSISCHLEKLLVICWVINIHFYSTEIFPSPKSWNVCKDPITASRMGFSVGNSTITNFSSNSEMQRNCSEKIPWKTSEEKFDLIMVPSFTIRESQTMGHCSEIKVFKGFIQTEPKWTFGILRCIYFQIWMTRFSCLRSPVLFRKHPCLESRSFAWFTSQKREFRIYFTSSTDCYRKETIPPRFAPSLTVTTPPNCLVLTVRTSTTKTQAEKAFP